MHGHLVLYAVVVCALSLWLCILQVQDGDIITIDASTKQMNVDVSEEELQQRRQSWKSPPYKNTRGTLYKYIKNVSSASLGCVTDL